MSCLVDSCAEFLNKHKEFHIPSKARVYYTMIGALERKASKKATEGALYGYKYFNDRVCNGT